ncbi:RNA polymerase sigma factor [Pseudochryseolinea flava]|uniref:RNA polymerase sigma factor n=1 Tax=Pseudochryseolinea flava TaxID=2059302 RepID=A0A364XWC1_9BACT|nr:RNA polymerase sigma factor [Pseudochryseolinea flava]RAV98628.1 RNA polymerase sigma factor [Pseudochryseolinea flava]
MTAIEFSYKIASLRSTLQTFTKRFTRDKEESHDLVQDTLLKALTYRDKFKEDTNLKGWLFTIMRNTFINNYRRVQRERTSHDRTKDLYYLNVEEDYTFNRPQESVEFKEIWQNVNHIKDEFLTPFKMYTSGYKYHEIAEHLHIPIGTVKNRIFHARKEIQKRLQGY